MTTEDRLRDALRGEAARIEPRDGWARIESRLGETVPRNRLRILSIAAAALVVLATGIVFAANRNGDHPVTAGQPESTTTSTTEVSDVLRPSFSWPLPGQQTYPTAHDVADGFARNFLGMPDPTVGEYRPGDTRSGEIDIHPFATGTIGSTLGVREETDGWHVFSANSDNLQLDQPKELDRITSPAHLTGRSVAFEGTVHVTMVSQDGTLVCARGCAGGTGTHPFLAMTTFTGHGTEMGPFATDVSFERYGATIGVLILWTDSARDGSVAEATLRLVVLS
jgi:hypothetical protein